MSDSSKTAPLDTYARFLTARWDEQEDAARTVTVEVSTYRRWSARDGQASVEVTPSVDVFTPAYVLADLAAKRAVLQIAARYQAVGAGGLLEMVEDLALPFRDHPDHPANTRLADISPEHAARIRARTDIKPLRLDHPDHPANQEA